MVRIFPAALLALALAVLNASAAKATKPIAPALLVAHRDDLPGFAHAEFKIQSSTSASSYARRILEERSREAQREVALLTREGFREGVQEQFHGEQGGGVSGAQVFSSSRSARAELLRAAKQELTNPAPEARFTVAAIPGSEGFTGKTGLTRRYADVLFVVGHCGFLIGDALYGTSTEAEAIRAPIAGATAVFRRVKHLCA